ncbi:hypothetical protein Rsub_12592 [Raphidocelis subcapitata]|uniref:Uncharacterized protein n=1 Tax=Raphidocelis subcapitata TaxID=307507 RepID=A0A2V0PGQ8_9CHLO|nr:hypothetical protein Rsub_12592 [Raphidocelis subcapitata]|eukprot:GBF98946.1 hypothetical protein Rsub_12592 [Raphidocelis subcapitata]
MGNLFAHHAKPGAITDADRAVLSLKAQRRKLEEQARLLERRMDHQVTVARQLVAANKKDRALLALQRKTLAQRQLEALAGHLLNVEDLLSGMELTKQQARIFSALQDGAAALKKAQSEERVHGALSAQLAPADEAAAAEELAELEAEFEGAEAAAAAAALPAAPARRHEPAAAGAAAAGAAAAGEEEEGAEREEGPEAGRAREPALVAA